MTVEGADCLLCERATPPEQTVLVRVISPGEDPRLTHEVLVCVRCIVPFTGDDAGLAARIDGKVALNKFIDDEIARMNDILDIRDRRGRHELRYNGGPWL